MTREPPPLGSKDTLSSKQDAIYRARRAQESRKANAAVTPIPLRATPPASVSSTDISSASGTYDASEGYPQINGKIVLPPPEDWSLVPLIFFSPDHAEEIRHRAPGLSMDEVLGRYGLSYSDLSLPEFIHDEWFFRVNYNIGRSTAKSDMVHALFAQARAKNGHQSALEFLVRFADNWPQLDISKAGASSSGNKSTGGSNSKGFKIILQDSDQDE